MRVLLFMAILSIEAFAAIERRIPEQMPTESDATITETSESPPPNSSTELTSSERTTGVADLSSKVLIRAKRDCASCLNGCSSCNGGTCSSCSSGMCGQICTNTPNYKCLPRGKMICNNPNPRPCVACGLTRGIAPFSNNYHNHNNYVYGGNQCCACCMPACLPRCVNYGGCACRLNRLDPMALERLDYFDYIGK